MPTRQHSTVTLALRKGEAIRHVTVTITAVEGNWIGEDSVRLEGYTRFDGANYGVIAVYHLHSTKSPVGDAELTQFP